MYRLVERMTKRDDENACQTTRHQPWDSRRILIDCDGYSFAIVAIDGSIKIQQSPPLIRMVVRKLGSQLRRLHGRPGGVIKSASRFDCAAEIAVQTRMTFNLTAVSCETFSLYHVLIDYVLGAVIDMAHGDSNGGGVDSRDGVHSAAKSGSYYAAETAPSLNTFAQRVLQHPLRPAAPD